MLKWIDQKADELLSKVGIKDKAIQDLLQIGGLAVIAYVIYRAWKKKGKETVDEN